MMKQMPPSTAACVVATNTQLSGKGVHDEVGGESGFFLVYHQLVVA